MRCLPSPDAGSGSASSIRSKESRKRSHPAGGSGCRPSTDCSRRLNVLAKGPEITDPLSEAPARWRPPAHVERTNKRVNWSRDVRHQRVAGRLFRPGQSRLVGRQVRHASPPFFILIWFVFLPTHNEPNKTTHHAPRFIPGSRSRLPFKDTVRCPSSGWLLRHASPQVACRAKGKSHVARLQAVRPGGPRGLTPSRTSLSGTPGPASRGSTRGIGGRRGPRCSSPCRRRHAGACPR